MGRWTGMMLVWGVFLVAASARGEVSLVGTWEHQEPGGTSITLVFNADGTGKMESDSIRYAVAGETLSLTIAGEVIKYNVKLEGDSLTVSGGDLEKPTVFKRKGAAPKHGLGARIGKESNEAPAAPPKVEAQAPAAREEKPTPEEIVGNWKDDVGMAVEITAKAINVGGVSIPYTKGANALSVSFQGQSMDWPYKLSGDTLELNIAGQATKLTRVGGRKAAAAPGAAVAENGGKEEVVKGGSIVGNWDGPDGFVQVRADGTLKAQGKEVRWESDEKFITLRDNTGWVKIPYKLDGDKLVLGTGPSKTLTRAKGAAGVWSGSESSLDPGNFMAVYHTLTLYSDGTVGFEKGESGASRRMVSEHLERFTSFKNRTGEKGKTYGKWEEDGNTITIRWQGAFGNKTMRGRFDPKGMKLVVEGMGILQEGAQVTFERQ